MTTKSASSVWAWLRLVSAGSINNAECRYFGLEALGK
jgi:hypothetical protein